MIRYDDRGARKNNETEQDHDTKITLLYTHYDN
jgi:hypothetical protein